ncbi:MAG TPA: FUSC family protein [Gaiellaceae bacterium]|nr:FUSC family protein [Gaiellaceae bacterium]
MPVRRLLAGRDLVAELRLAIKMTIGGTGAWSIASELGAKRPIFAALVPLVAMSGDPFAAVSVSIARILGVFAGVGVGLALTHVAAGPTWRVGIALLVATLVGIVLKVGERPNLEVPIAALFLIGFASANVSQLGVQRIWETAIGAVVAVVVSAVLWPPDPIRELARRLDRLRQQLATDLAAIADDLATGSGGTAEQLDELREHSLDAVRDVFELASARRALRWSPLRRKDVRLVDDLEQRINLGARAARHVRSVGRDVADTHVRSPELAAATRHLADALDRALLGQDRADALARAARELAAARGDEDQAIVAAQLRQFLADLR